MNKKKTFNVYKQLIMLKFNYVRKTNLKRAKEEKKTEQYRLRIVQISI